MRLGVCVFSVKPVLINFWAINSWRQVVPIKLLTRVCDSAQLDAVVNVPLGATFDFCPSPCSLTLICLVSHKLTWPFSSTDSLLPRGEFLQAKPVVFPPLITYQWIVRGLIVCSRLSFHWLHFEYTSTIKISKLVSNYVKQFNIWKNHISITYHCVLIYHLHVQWLHCLVPP